MPLEATLRLAAIRSIAGEASTRPHRTVPAERVLLERRRPEPVPPYLEAPPPLATLPREGGLE